MSQTPATISIDKDFGEQLIKTLKSFNLHVMAGQYSNNLRGLEQFLQDNYFTAPSKDLLKKEQI